MSFVITGFGRSGTKFLAQQLNKSFCWEVAHEPDATCLVAKERFNSKNYGEVNSYLLYYLKSLPITHRILIVRNPYELLRSAVQMGHYYNVVQGEIQRAIALITAYVDEGMYFIKFAEMVQSKEVILDIARYVGITDLNEKDIDLKPVNASKPKACTYEIAPSVDNDFRYFIERFEL